MFGSPASYSCIDDVVHDSYQTIFVCTLHTLHVLCYMYIVMHSNQTMLSLSFSPKVLHHVETAELLETSEEHVAIFFRNNSNSRNSQQNLT